MEAVKPRVDRLWRPLDWRLWRLRVEADVEAVEARLKAVEARVEAQVVAVEAVEAVEAQVETVEARVKDVGCRGGEHWYVVGKSSVLS